MICSSCLIKHLNVLCLFSQDTSGVCPLRTHLTTALLFCSHKLETLVLSSAKFHPFQIKPAEKHPEPIRLKNIQTCYPLHSKIHIHISECLEKEVREGEKKGKGADFLILTQRALRHAISPNYEERERRGGE